MRSDQERMDATNRRALIRSRTVTRGFVGATLLVLGGLAFTLLLSAFLEYLTIARNDRAGAREPWSWDDKATR